MGIDSGRVAFITGGASGIGLGIAAAFLERGVKVAVADIRDDHLAEADACLAVTGGDYHLLKLDVADRRQWTKGADDAERALGEIDILCANAGIAMMGRLEDATWDDWDWVLSVNLRGVVNGLEVVLPRIRAHRRGGHVVATSSVGGLVAASDSAIYQTTKFGVTAAMECLREDLADEGIGVSILCPSAVATNIRDHAQMRPSQFSNTRQDPIALGGSPEEAEALGPIGGDPIELGRHVLGAIERNQPYIMTDPKLATIVESRRDAILAGLPKA